MPEIRHHNEPPSCHAEHFGEQAARVANLLQSLAEHREVERIVRDVGQPPVKIRLNGRQTPPNHLQQIVLLNFHTQDVAAEFLMEAVKEPAVATTKVNDSAASSDVLHDQLISEAHGGVGNLIAGTLGHVD
jgi:hypothetical protein